MYIVEPGEIAEDDKSIFNAEIKSVKTKVGRNIPPPVFTGISRHGK